MFDNIIVNSLKKQLDHPNNDKRMQAIHKLGAMNTPASIEALSMALYNENKERVYNGS